MCSSVDPDLAVEQRLHWHAPFLGSIRVTADGVIDTLSRQGPFRIVNIGGQPVGLLDFIDAIEATLGKKAIRNFLPMQKGDVPETVAAPDQLRELTSYVAQTMVQEDVMKFVEWYRTRD